MSEEHREVQDAEKRQISAFTEGNDWALIRRRLRGRRAKLVERLVNGIHLEYEQMRQLQSQIKVLAELSENPKGFLEEGA